MFDSDGTYVALDLETTGLDLDRDRITEIGAMRFDAEGRELAAFEQLVDPGRPIPQFIETLTGVTNDAVRAAPAFAEVASALAAFVGEGPIVGQNVGFDLAHLERAGLSLTPPVFDTGRLSHLVMPGHTYRGLSELAAGLGIATPMAHRALPDARTAAAVFVELRRRAAALPREQRLLLARFVAIEQPALAREIAGDELALDEELVPPALPERWKPPAPLERAEVPEPVARGDVASAFAAAARIVPRFEDRPQQLEMSEAVADAFSDGGQWLIEAGTGVGKSLAYLVPAALYALRNGTRVVVSTNTIALQEQLLGKDVPTLREILLEAGAIGEAEDLRVATLKGRANYLCLQRWVGGHQANLADPDVARLAAALALWLPRTPSGDRGELNLEPGARAAWARFSAAEVDCLSRQHTFVRDGRCFLHRARKTAESAHIVIVNHALLLADIATGRSAIPPFDHLIVDEAHNLEGQATQQFGLHVGPRQVMDILDGIYRPRSRDRREGGIATVVAGFHGGLLAAAADAVTAGVTAATKQLNRPFDALSKLKGEGGDERLLTTPGMRHSPDWEEVEAGWAGLDAELGNVVDVGRSAAHLLGEVTEGDERQALAGELETAVGRLETVRRELASMVAGNDPGTIVWASTARDGLRALNAAPLEVGPRLAEELFEDRATVIGTGATLAAAGSMAFAANQLGLPEAEALQLGSPFDYERSTLLVTPTEMPAPNETGYDEAAAAAIVKLVRASEGRALALFTSHASLRRVAALARDELEGEGIGVMVQGRDGSAPQLTDNLIDNPRAVIFGTSSFWEGIDIRGQALSLIVIARLPFPVPTDPIHRARSDLYDDPFGDYSLPAAILRFRQGFGRLIRDREDRGVVALLDSRVRSKRYGADFLRALPPCTTLTADTDTLAAHSREWLAR